MMTQINGLIKKVKLINPTSNNLAEFEALEEGLKLCQKLRLSNIIIKGNSQIILNAIRNRETPNWVLNSKLKVIKMVDQFAEVWICHIYREGNWKADLLANKGVDGIYILNFKDTI